MQILPFFRGSNKPSSHYYWQEEKALLAFYQKLMEALYGQKLFFNLSLDFDKAGWFGRKKYKDLDSTIFLAKNVTDIRLLNKDGKILPKAADIKNVAAVTAIFYDFAEVTYTKGATGTPSRFEVKNITSDYQNSDVSDAEQAIMERANYAFVLVELAKAAGLKDIGFGDTKDPLERYLLQQACKALKVRCRSEHVDPADIPVCKAFSEPGKPDAKMIADRAIAMIKNNPQRTARKEAPKANNDNYLDPAASLDALNLDLAA